MRLCCTDSSSTHDQRKSVNVVNHEESALTAIYARTSSPNQRFNYSIEQQVSECWRYCDERGWITKYVFVDQCQSAKTIERPKLQLMFEKAKAREFHIIVFWKIDRFCRSLVDLVNVERTLKQCGVELCSVTEFIDTTTSVGRFNYRNLASVAELEGELIGERARLGLYGLARENKWPNPHPPLGYDKDQNGKLKINENEAELVHKIFRMYICEKSMPQVAFKLNTQKNPTKKNGKWNARAVRDVLTNRIYKGEYHVAGVESRVDGCRIVTDDLFNEANEMMLRYRSGRAERRRMPEDRKMMKIDNLFNTYHQFLQELGQESPAHNWGR